MQVGPVPNPGREKRLTIQCDGKKLEGGRLTLCVNTPMTIRLSVHPDEVEGGETIRVELLPPNASADTPQAG